jgi:hypothetical protein
VSVLVGGWVGGGGGGGVGGESTEEPMFGFES